MPDIRYVILSDMHLGAENSILTHPAEEGTDVDPSKPSEAMVGLAACIRDLVSKNTGTRKPTLVPITLPTRTPGSQ